MLNSRQLFGKSGEETVAVYLQKKGYRIVDKNYRCKVGEIDIIAWDGPVLVFIEVKTRSDSRFGSPSAAVGARKQRQISRSAQWYLEERQLVEPPARFDVVSVCYEKSNQPRIDHINNAFEFCE